LGTATPPHLLDQDEVRRVAMRRFAGGRLSGERLAKAFETAGVRRRRSVAPLDWFEAEHDAVARNDVYLDTAPTLFADAARAALDAAGLAASQIDAVVAVSSTGIATPTLEARAHAALGLRPDAIRVPLFGLGCAGGVSGLALAARLARAMPGARVLMVAVETCTLGFRGAEPRKADVIAAILFGDGAAGAVVSTEPGPAGDGPILGEGHEHLWPDTLDVMGWTLDPLGLQVVFDRSIPDFVTRELAPALPDGAQDATPALHPGGTKVVEAFETALSLPAGALDQERAVLTEFGNMSAPTALFVLQRKLAAGAAGPMLLGALGPGFTLSLLPLTVGGAP
jgi:alkylresorcinol/alkylpyrone synthase